MKPVKFEKKPVEFEKSPAEFQDLNTTTDRFRGIYGIYLKLVKK
jgi:hypothetical protein